MSDSIDSLLARMSRRISRLRLSRLVDPTYWKERTEIYRLRRMDRGTPGFTGLLGRPTRLVDAASFLSAYHAIFEKEIYALEPDNDSPLIIDGGANIGLATLYWKRKIPDARILAFEPDPEIYAVLEWNCRAHGYPDVELLNHGLWSEDTTLLFRPEAGDAGTLVDQTSEVEPEPEISQDSVPVPVSVVRLPPYLDGPVDLLKLDVEGAEVEVLLDCRDSLASVSRVFVEYHSFVDREQRLDELLHVLRHAGFRVHVQPELVAKRPFVQRPESYGMDQRLNIFAYRS